MKLNRKGFTLIELLAVITILGILMIVGIPAVQRTINNSRRDTFLDTAKEYANSVKTAWAADELDCGSGLKPSSAAADTDYYVYFASNTGAVEATDYGIAFTQDDADNQKQLVQSGGKSSWGSAEVGGFVKIHTGADITENNKYYVNMVDSKGHGINANVNADNADTSDELERGDVNISGAKLTAPSATPNKCKLVG